MKQLTLSAKQLAELTGGRICGDPERTISRVAGIKEAGPEDLSFVGNKKYEHLLQAAKAGIVMVCPDLAGADCTGRTLIVCDSVDYAFGKAAELFAEEPPEAAPGIHPSAVIGQRVKLGLNVSIGANAVIEDDAEIGDNTVIGALCYIGHEVKIGVGNLIYPRVTVMYRCRIGNGNIIHSGVVIGADGFGFIPGPKGLVKVPQTGIVQIDDDVEIGANTTIDRARFGKTWVKSNVKIDDLVMVAHNVVVGESSILVGQSGIAGSAVLGRGVVLAGKAGINGHTEVGDGTQVAGTSNVLKDTEPGAIILGTPGESQREFLFRYSLPKKFKAMDAKVKELEAKLKALESK